MKKERVRELVKEEYEHTGILSPEYWEDATKDIVKQLQKLKNTISKIKERSYCTADFNFIEDRLDKIIRKYS